MPHSLSIDIMRIKPYWLSTAAAAFGFEINKIFLLPSGVGSATVYTKTAANLTTALAAMASGDIVQIHGPCTLTGNFTIPAGGRLIGISEGITLAGTVTLGNGARIDNLTIAATTNDANPLYGILGPTGATAYVYDCIVTATQSGAGNAYAVGAINGTYLNGGNVYCVRSWVEGISVGGSGYGARSTAGYYKQWHGRAVGSTGSWTTT